ncbi:MAG: thiamine diphosphokinase, partial [Chloroflexota bacterium]
MGHAPHLLVGDLDSISPAALQALAAAGCQVVRHRPDKEETDAELALLAARARGATHITLLGATGGRIDHELANVQLLAMPQLQGIHVAIYDGLSWLWLAEGLAEIRGAVGDLVSLIPWGGDVEDIVTEGLRYPLRHEALALGPARGVSNLLTQPLARVTWARGRLLIVHTPRIHLEAAHG